MFKIFSFVIFLISIPLFSQVVSIDFEGASLMEWEESTAGRWCVDTDAPITGFGSLHHDYDASEASIDIISYKHTQLRLDSSATEWQFAIRYNYKPSSANNWAFCLTSSCGADEIYPTGASEGYILGVNYTGSDDKIKLWRHDDGNSSVVIESEFNWQENISIGESINFKITRSINSEWTIQIDTLNSTFFTIGIGIDSTYTKSENIGVYYEYSSTQDRKLWVDDILVTGTFIADLEPPEVSSFFIQEKNEISLQFNEEIDTTAEVLFVLNGKYETVNVKWINGKSVVLIFNQIFDQENLLEIYRLTDLKENINQLESINFNYFTPELHDVLITEIMADPIPQFELPECEYIELYNRSTKTLNIKGWSLVSGERTPAFFEEYFIEPNSYMLLVDDGCFNEFPDSIAKIALPTFPLLPNTGEVVELRDIHGKCIHGVNYDDDWHFDGVKKDGGWSLEMVDTEYPCLVSNNWMSSTSEVGGTPGFKNSVAGLFEVYPTAVLKGISNITENSFQLNFSEVLDSTSAADIVNYRLLGSDIFISSVIPVSDLFTEFRVVLSDTLLTNQLYTLEIDENLRDCSGISVYADLLTFGVPQNADSTDIVINEILFEANDFVPEFIELYNKSDKVIALEEIRIASIDNFADTIISLKTIINSEYQFFSKSFVVLTEDKHVLRKAFPDLNADNVVELDSWLKLLNSGGKIGILNGEGDIIDLAVFAPDMHFSLLDSTSGISLERISIFQSGTDTKNWHSAASVVNYATPGNENSQAYTSDSEELLISISPKEFSPDNDGWDDFLTIEYNFPQSGYVANVKIYTQRGVLVNQLINNELCGMAGNFVWDGLNEDAGRLSMGYYIIYFEAWHPNGDVIKEKMVSLLLPEKK